MTIFFKDEVKNAAPELEPVEQKSEPVVDELDALIAQTEAVAQELDEAEVSEGRLWFNFNHRFCFPAVLV